MRSHASRWDTDFVVALPDLTVALVVTTDGCSLLGGGVDDARARFGRVAKKLGGALPGIAAHYPPLHLEWVGDRE